MPENFHFPIIPRLRPNHVDEPLRRAGATIAARGYFARCANETHALAGDGDFTGAAAQIENLIVFELAPSAGRNAPPANGACHLSLRRSDRGAPHLARQGAARRAVQFRPL
jgi:hypothetical protein